MRDLLLNGKKSFSEFLVSDEKIASNILADRLYMLVQEGTLTKRASPANKSKFLYHPTQKGLDLIPVLCEVVLWAEQHGATGREQGFHRALENG
jgi:DNA-binding HxlR family transcriptional regulator